MSRPENPTIGLLVYASSCRSGFERDIIVRGIEHLLNISERLCNPDIGAHHTAAYRRVLETIRTELEIAKGGKNVPETACCRAD